MRAQGLSVVLVPSCASGADGVPAVRRGRQRVRSAGCCASGVVAGERSPSEMRITPSPALSLPVPVSPRAPWAVPGSGDTAAVLSPAAADWEGIQFGMGMCSWSVLPQRISGENSSLGAKI